MARPPVGMTALPARGPPPVAAPEMGCESRTCPADYRPRDWRGGCGPPDAPPRDRPPPAATSSGTRSGYRSRLFPTPETGTGDGSVPGRQGLPCVVATRYVSRPAAFAAYRASSAAWRTWATGGAVVGVDGHADGGGDPDADRRVWTRPRDRTGNASPRTAVRSRRASVIPPSASVSGSSSTNSSPPERNAKSTPRISRSDPAGELDQYRVAGRVPVDVVDLLEPVQVQGDRAERVAEPGRPVDLAAQQVLEVAVVVQAGQRVGVGQPLGLVVQPHVIHRDRRVPGEGPHGTQVGVVEVVVAGAVVERDNTAHTRRVPVQARLRRQYQRCHGLIRRYP